MLRDQQRQVHLLHLFYVSNVCLVLRSLDYSFLTWFKLHIKSTCSVYTLASISQECRSSRTARRMRQTRIHHSSGVWVVMCQSENWKVNWHPPTRRVDGELMTCTIDNSLITLRPLCTPLPLVKVLGVSVWVWWLHSSSLGSRSDREQRAKRERRWERRGIKSK